MSFVCVIMKENPRQTPASNCPISVRRSKVASEVRSNSESEKESRWSRRCRCSSSRRNCCNKRRLPKRVVDQMKGLKSLSSVEILEIKNHPILLATETVARQKVANRRLTGACIQQ